MNFSSIKPGCAASGSRSRLVRWLLSAALVASFDTFALGLGGGEALYDAGEGVLPSAAPWNWQFGALGTQIHTGMTPSASATYLDTTQSSGYAGYDRQLAPGGLDSATGFSLDFSVRILAESHASANRSGFSVIVLDHEKKGVELSFWTDQVFAKNADSGFSHAESKAIDTSSERIYRLTFLGDNYSVSADGSTLLSGTRRDYQPVAPAPFDALVYGKSNYIFFGDNTTSAAANVELSMINYAPVPEPAEWMLLLAGLGCIGAMARRRCR